MIFNDQSCNSATSSLRAEVAQLAEHSPEKAGVDSSILSLGTILPRTYKLPSLFQLSTNCPKLPVAHLIPHFLPLVSCNVHHSLRPAASESLLAPRSSQPLSDATPTDVDSFQSFRNFVSGKPLHHGTFRLGGMYDEGLGFPEDPRKAFELYKQSLQTAWTSGGAGQTFGNS